MKRILLSLYKRFAKSRLFQFYNKLISALTPFGVKLSFSQFAEDMILETLLPDKKNGLFIDVGCNMPIDSNNTYKFYLKGWRGINIDGNEEIIRNFKKIRKKDTNICQLVSDVEEEVTFYISDENRVSTISDDFYESRKDIWNYSKKVTAETRKLSSILDEYIDEDTAIDLLNIDVEGHDFEVLRSTDFSKYRPQIICVENHEFDFDNYNNDPIIRFMRDNRYKLAAAVKPNLFFKENETNE